MRIGIVCYPTFGGSGVVATELGKILADKGDEVHFITYKQPVRLDLLSPRTSFHEVNVPEYPLFKYQPYELALSSKIVDVVKFCGIDLLHVHYAVPHAYAAFMANQILKHDGISIPIVTTLHGTDITLVGSHPHYKPAVTFSINKSNAVTAVSESLKKDTQILFGIDKNIEIIPNFINFQTLNRATKTCDRSHIANQGCKIVTHISNLRKVKRVGDVIRVFYKIQEQVFSKLVLIGEGPEKDAAVQLASSLGISDKVLFLGNSTEIDRVLHYSDIFLLPSETESFGLGALEAMANKTPVISSNTGGLPEVNLHGQTGFLFEVGDIEGMAQAAISLLKDGVKLNKYKQRAFLHSKQFDINHILPLYTNVYRKVLS